MLGLLTKDVSMKLSSPGVKFIQLTWLGTLHKAQVAWLTTGELDKLALHSWQVSFMFACAAVQMWASKPSGSTLLGSTTEGSFPWVWRTENPIKSKANSITRVMHIKAKLVNLFLLNKLLCTGKYTKETSSVLHREIISKFIVNIIFSRFIYLPPGHLSLIIGDGDHKLNLFISLLWHYGNNEWVTSLPCDIMLILVTITQSFVLQAIRLYKQNE